MSAQRVLAGLRAAAEADAGFGSASFIEATIEECVERHRLFDLDCARVVKVERWHDREPANPSTVQSAASLTVQTLDELGAADPEGAFDALMADGFYDESDPSQPMVLVWVRVISDLPGPAARDEGLGEQLLAPRRA